MKKIPIWDCKIKTIIPHNQYNLNYSSNHYALFPSVSMTPIYIDQYHQIYTTAVDQIPPPEYDNENQQQHCSVVYDRRNNSISIVQIPIYACILIDEYYYVVTADCCLRYDVLCVGVDEFAGTMQDMIKNGGVTDKIEQINTVQTKDTGFKPLRKINPVFYSHKNIIHLSSCRAVHPWEITSPLWAYSPHLGIWKQYTQDTPVIPHSRAAQQWVFNLQDYLIVISSNKIWARRQKHGNQQYDTIVLATSATRQLVDPHTDSFVYSYYTDWRLHACLLVLVKTSSQQRQPILLQFSVSGTTHANGPNYDKNSYKSTMKSTVSSSANTNTNMKDINEAGITLIRYDIGIFLDPNNTQISESNYNSVSSTCIANSRPHSNYSSNARLWGIINQVVYMQVTETSTMYTPGFATTNNFIKKTQSTHHGRKTHMVNLYTKTIKNTTSQWPNTSPTIQLLNYSIKLHALGPIQFSATNVQLYKYFQAKEYCDLLFVAEKREVPCNKHLFQFYSPRFKKLYINSNTLSAKNNNNVYVRLDHTKLETVYFLVQLLYHGFADIHDIDQVTLIDLMILAHKFQITQLQALCEQQINFSLDNFQKLYDYFRNSQTSIFREKLLKFFVINAQQIIKIMPIGKVQQIIRLVYSPECAHNNFSQIKAKLQSTYSIKDTQGETRQINKCINYAGIIKSQQIGLKICMKCSKLLGYNHQSHKKNKSSVRGSSLGSFGHRKKQNNSN